MNRRDELAATAAERMNRIRKPGRYGAQARALVATTDQRADDFTNVARNHLTAPTADTAAMLARFDGIAERADRIRAERVAP